MKINRTAHPSQKLYISFYNPAMKILLIPFFVLAAESITIAQQPESMPSGGRPAKTNETAKPTQKAGLRIEEIADKFYNTYETGVEYLVFTFEKRAGNWRINTRKWQAGNLIPAGNYLFYDVDSGGYQRLPFPPKKDTLWVDFRLHVDEFQQFNYNLQEYYGYSGWYKDVIATLFTKKRLTDSSLNCLARAYSAYGECLLTNQTGDALQSELFDLPMERNCMSPAQREKYHQIQQKAILTYAQLNQRNPNFETIVGKAPIKYANEVMVEFHTYLTFADEYATTFKLPDHLYVDSIFNIAKRILEKCPPEAILLSLGDNDFYPILYVQHQLGLRKDVRLINRNLMGLDRFIYMATQPQFQSKPVRLTVPLQRYQGNTNDYLYLKDQPEGIPFGEVIDTIENGHRDESGALTLPSKEFIIKRRPGIGISVKEGGVRFRETTGYILKSDWILLDIMNNLDGRRLACETELDGSLAPLNAYFARTDDYLFVY
jgi:hypothetical protein